MTSHKSIHEVRFDAAVKVIENLPYDGLYQPSDDMMRVFYGYFKQATVGPCDVPKPSYWDSEGKAKWEAWKALGDMTKERAMIEYVEKIKLILEILPVSEEVSELLDVLDNFYEFVDDGDLSKSVEFTAERVMGSEQSLKNGNMGISDTTYKYGGEASDDGDDEEEEDEIQYDEKKEKESKILWEEEEDQCVDPTRPVIDVTEWRGGSPVYNGSGENSSSSLTSDTHSSLNSQDEEDELAYSQEASYEKILCHVDRPLTNDNGVTSEQSCQTRAPDDLHCDSSEHPAPEEGDAFPRIPLPKPGESQAKRQNPQGGNKAIECGEQDSNAQCGPHATEAHGTVQPDQSSIQMKGSSSPGTALCYHGKGDITDSQRSKTVSVANINKDIAMALTRLQADMQDVLQRLNTLEALSSSQTKSLALRKEHLINETKKRTSWWPFSLSPVTMSLAIAWPLLVHWIVDFYYQRRRNNTEDYISAVSTSTSVHS